jgi:3-hydroxybutyryl-CoA dehydrogenase
MNSIKTIAVIGAGTMGRGVAQVAALSGFLTWIYDLNEELLQTAMSHIEASLRKGKELGKVPDAAFNQALENLRTTHDFGEAASECDFLIESVPENIEIKLDTFRRADRGACPNVVLATNTSALSITEIACAVENPKRVIGMHFFNPVHLMRLVEIVRGLETSEETFKTTVWVALKMGKEIVDVKESPGFITSRINAMIGNEAFHMLQEGIASPRDIDKAIKLGLNHPMGPFEMVDLVGLDTRLSVLKFLHERLGEKYRPCPLLVQYVSAGRLGKKVGRGVYEY